MVGGDGVKPWDEDKWKEVRISGSHMALCKPCSRCKITTTDQVLVQSHATDTVWRQMSGKHFDTMDARNLSASQLILT